MKIIIILFFFSNILFAVDKSYQELYEEFKNNPNAFDKIYDAENIKKKFTKDVKENMKKAKLKKHYLVQAYLKKLNDNNKIQPKQDSNKIRLKFLFLDYDNNKLDVVDFSQTLTSNTNFIALVSTIRDYQFPFYLNFEQDKIGNILLKSLLFMHKQKTDIIMLRTDFSQMENIFKDYYMYDYEKYKEDIISDIFYCPPPVVNKDLKYHHIYDGEISIRRTIIDDNGKSIPKIFVSGCDILINHN